LGKVAVPLLEIEAPSGKRKRDDEIHHFRAETSPTERRGKELNKE